MQHLNLELHTSKSIQMLLFCLILYTAKFLILQVNVEGIPLLEENATRYQFVAISGACLH